MMNMSSKRATVQATSLILQLTHIIFYLICFSIEYAQGQGTTSCTGGEVYINMTTNKAFLTTPDYGRAFYPSNMSCRFILKAPPNHRILLEVEDIQMEPQLFDECLDMVVVSKSNSLVKADQIASFCGSEAKNRQVSSSDDLLVVSMISDAFVEERGAKLSYLALDPHQCNPGWVDGTNGSCFRFIDLHGGSDWVSAQAQCAEQQSNLMIIEDEETYYFTVDWLGNSSSHPWIGYNDANNEGVIKGMNELSDTIWPQPQLHLTGNDNEKDCVFLDLSTSHVNEGELIYRIGDCRMKQSFICEKKRDGSTVVVPNPAEKIRIGGMATHADIGMWVLLVVLLVLISVILCIACKSCKKRDNRVHTGAPPPNTLSSSNENNQTTHRRAQPATQATAPPRSLPTPPRQVEPVATPEVPKTIQVVPKISPKPQKFESGDLGGPSSSSAQDHHHFDSRETALLERRESTERLAPEPLPRTLPPLPIREMTYNTINTREESFMRSKRTGELFERPKMNVLDNISAISLDEFWSNKRGGDHP